MMIGQSPLAITLISALIVIGTVYIALIIIRFRATVLELGSVESFVLILIGLVAIASLYMMDLFALYVTPLFVPDADSLGFVEAHHLKYGWYTNLIGIVFLLLGLRMVFSHFLPRVSTEIRARKQEQARVESQNLISRTTLENMNQGILMVDGNNQILVYNKTFLKYMGIPEEQASSLKHVDELHELVAKFLSVDTMKRSRNVGQQGGKFSYEIRNAEGEIFDVRQNSIVGGGLVRTYTDITDRKQSEAFSDEVLSNTMDAIITSDTSGIVETYNNAAEKIFGYSADEVIGNNVSMLMPQSIAREHDGYLRKYLSSEGTLPDSGRRQIVGATREVTGQRKDGTIIPLDIAVSEVQVGGKHAFVGLLHDISERKQAEAQQHYRLEIEHAIGSVLRRIAEAVDINEAVEDSLKELGGVCRASRVTLLQFDEVWADQSKVLDWCASDSDSCTNVVQKILTKMYVEQEESFFPGFPAKRIIYVKNIQEYFSESPLYQETLISHGIHSFLGCPIREKGQLVAYLIVVNPEILNSLVRPDISQMVIFGESLINSLERRKSEVALQEAKKEAEAANSAKAGFLATMSHEIRTPMNGVLGMVDLLMQSSDEFSSDQREMLHTISESGHSLLTIINDILDFSKIESGKIDLEAIPFSILDVVEESAQSFVSNANRKGIHLITYVDPSLPPYVVGDPVRIRQILVNLVGNAIKFTEQGYVIVRAERIASANEQDHEITLRLSVTDQGIGISEDEQDSLFQAYSQAKSSTTRKFGGTGLGLSICKKLTELMHGEIGVESEPGEGSEFYCSIPFRLSDRQADSPEVTDALSGLRMLVMNRNPLEQDILRSYLEHWNVEVDCGDDLADLPERCLKEAATGRGYDAVIFGPQWQRNETLTSADYLRAESLCTKFVFLLTHTRKKHRGNSKNNGVFLDMYPIRRKAFISAVAIAVGKQSPEIYHEETIEDLKSSEQALTVEEAREQGTLILVAEDNATNRNVIGRQLHLLGYTCEMAEDGQIALEAWRTGDYALLLTDCSMPNMDGFELARTIRRDETGTDSHATIIAITANTMEGDDVLCFEAGMDDFISKPMKLEELRQKLEEWMPKRKMNSGA